MKLLRSSLLELNIANKIAPDIIYKLKTDLDSLD